MTNLVEITVRARDGATRPVENLRRRIGRELAGLRRTVQITVDVVDRASRPLADVARLADRLDRTVTAGIRVDVVPADAVQDLRDALDNLARTTTVHVGVQVAPPGVLDDLRDAMDRAARTVTARVDVRVSPSGAVDDLRDAMDRLSRSLTVHVRVDVSPRDAVTDLRDALDRVVRSVTVRVRVNVTPPGAFEVMREQLDRMTRHIVVTIDLDIGSALRDVTLLTYALDDLDYWSDVEVNIRVAIDSIEEVRGLLRLIERIDGGDFEARIEVDVDRDGLRSLLDLSGMLAGMAGRVAGVARTMAGLAGKIATVGAAAAGAGAAGVKIAEFGRVVGGAAPALLAFAAAGKIVQGTLKLIFAEGSAARNALQPFADTVTAAGAKASEAAAKGIRPLAAELSRAVRPDVERMMTRIGNATNRVQREFFTWAKSAQGVHAIHNILAPIGVAAERLAPAISRVAISFTSMLGRIMGVSMAAGTSGLTGILDRLADKFDSINASTVTSGLNKLKDTVETVRNAFSKLVEWVGKAADVYRRHQTEFSALADGMAIAAIAFGGPTGIIIGSVSLLIRHADDLKAAWQRVRDYFTSTPEGMGIAENLKETGRVIRETVVTAFEALERIIRDKILPFLRDQLAPAFSNYVLPAMRDAAAFVKDTVIPALERLGNVFYDHLAPAFDRVVGAIQENREELALLQDGARRVAEVVVNLATSALASQLVDGLGAASRAISFMIDTLGLLIRRVAEAAATLLNLAATAIGVFRDMLNGALILVDGILGAFSKLPFGMGEPFRQAQREVAAFRSRANTELSAAEAKVRQTAIGINNWLAGIQNKTIEVRINQRTYTYPANYGQGGTTTIGGYSFPRGMATGGPVRRGTPYRVGERGEELFVPETNGRILDAATTRRALAAASGPRAGAFGGRSTPAHVVLELHAGSGKLDRLLLELLREAIRVRGGDPVKVLRPAGG